MIRDLTPKNRELLQIREDIQTKIDAWHKANPGAINLEAYRAFLEELGYLLPERDSFEVDTGNVDPEIAEIAGPQLVVPVMNARYALNAANARWGSLYDALYGTDAMGTTPQAGGYDPKRGAEVIAYARKKLDEALPLDEGSWADVTEFAIMGGSLALTLENEDMAGLQDPLGFLATLAIKTSQPRFCFKRMACTLTFCLTVPAQSALRTKRASATSFWNLPSPPSWTAKIPLQPWTAKTRHWPTATGWA